MISARSSEAFGVRLSFLALLGCVTSLGAPESLNAKAAEETAALQDAPRNAEGGLPFVDPAAMIASHLYEAPLYAHHERLCCQGGFRR